MLDFIINQTMEFLETMPKLTRKKKGQFFTSKETAVFMASLFDFSNIPDTIEILDPGRNRDSFGCVIGPYYK